MKYEVFTNTTQKINRVRKCFSIGLIAVFILAIVTMITMQSCKKEDLKPAKSFSPSPKLAVWYGSYQCPCVDESCSCEQTILDEDCQSPFFCGNNIIYNDFKNYKKVLHEKYSDDEIA